MEKEFLPHLNVQTNSNLSWSLLTVSQLIDFWDNCPRKLNYLAIADYYPYEVGSFLRSCKEKNIKPVWGVKIFVRVEEGKKYSATIYPQNNRAGREIITKLFGPASPPDRTFAWDYVLSNFSKDCFIVGEVQQRDDINFFSQFIATSPNIFIEGREDYQKVLEKELVVIEKLGYVDYFLLFSEVAEYLRGQNIIVGPGRGSAVSSLVVYLLGITSIDPLQHNLFFERFLNEKRKKLPDIDLDVESQEEVFDYLRKKYSPNQVARIVTRKKIGWKMAGLESAKIFRYPSFLALTEKIQDLYYNTSVHPSGVVIAERSLVGTVPVKSEKDFLVTFFEENQLTQLGFKKYDFLSLKETLSFVSLIKGLSSLRRKSPSYHEVDLTDPKTWKLLTHFCLTGIFQLDTPNARNLFSRFRPSNFAELVIFLALNRPGMKKRVNEIISRKIGREKSTFVSPVLTKIFSETFGLVVFEEQISQILALVYDCSFAEAEVKRRTMATAGLTKDFFARTRQQKLVRTDSELLYQQITSAQGYTFNKAHAVAYGYLTYYVAYLKANFFPEFIIYFLNEKKGKNLVCLQEAFAWGFELRGPDINYSQVESLGCYLSFFSRYQEITKSKQATSLSATFREYNNQEITVDIYAIICQINKDNADTWTIWLQDVRSSFKLEIKDQEYQIYQKILAIHNELLFTCQIQIINQKINFINLKRVREMQQDIIKVRGLLTSRIEKKPSMDIPAYGFFSLEGEMKTDIPVVFRIRDQEGQWLKPKIPKNSLVDLEGYWAKSSN
ncbi:17460_t:CDS:2, partial [Racocetra fulgida]